MNVTKKLYIMRHGETLFNKRNKIQGACDSPLTELGIKQAKIAGEYFKENHIEFTHAYASTQERASDTLELVVDMPYQRIKGIKEWDFGVFEGESEDLNPPMDPERGSYGAFFKQYHGEEDLEVQKRMNDTLTALMEKEDHQSVLAVSHGGAIYMFLKRWLNLETYPKKISFSNCCILEFNYRDGEFEFVDIVNHDFEK